MLEPSKFSIELYERRDVCWRHKHVHSQDWIDAVGQGVTSDVTSNIEVPVTALIIPILILIPVNAPEKAAESSPNLRTSSTIWELNIKFLSPGFSLALPSLYWGCKPAKITFSFCFSLSNNHINISKEYTDLLLWPVVIGGKFSHACTWKWRIINRVWEVWWLWCNLGNWYIEIGREQEYMVQTSVLKKKFHTRMIVRQVILQIMKTDTCE